MEKSEDSILCALPSIADKVNDCSRYWAHKGSACTLKAETLSEHTSLVRDTLIAFVSEYNLDEVIRGLLHQVAEENELTDSFASAYLSTCFWEALVYHDIGKINGSFQKERMENPAFKTDAYSKGFGSKHSELGRYLYLYLCMSHLMTLTDDGEVCCRYMAVVNAFSYIIDRHHSSQWDKVGGISENVLSVEQEAAINHYIMLLKSPIAVPNFLSICGAITTNVIADFSLFSLLKLGSSLLTSADFIATNRYMNGYELEDFGRFSEKRKHEIAETFRSIAYNRSIYTSTSTYSAKNHLMTLNEVRTAMGKEVLENVENLKNNRLFYLQAPTGAGKTNLSLLACTALMEQHEEIDKVYYVFPFTTLITQTYQVVKNSWGLRDTEVAEIHSKSTVMSGNSFRNMNKAIDDEQENGYLTYQFGLYPVVLTSHITFFNILTSSQKSSNYLYQRLQNSVVVIDELQCYSSNLWTSVNYFIQHVASEFNIRFILMSATLPEIGYLLTDGTSSSVYKDLLPSKAYYMSHPCFANRIHFNYDLLEIEDLSIEQLWDCVEAESKDYMMKYGGVRTIVEFIFKRSASSFYQHALEMGFFDEVYLLSGTILESRRREIIQRLKMQDSQKILLVTTQVVEAGVDIDMDLGFKNRSLLDSEEQLAGRINRNGKKSDAKVFLFEMDNPQVLYGKDYRYRAMWDKLKPMEHREILEQKSFERLYEKVFEVINKKQNSIAQCSTQSELINNGIKQLDYRQVEHSFRLIATQNITVYVPLVLPKVNNVNSQEYFFSIKELQFLESMGVDIEREGIDGGQVWEGYERFFSERNTDYSNNRMLCYKIWQSILSKYCFSLVLYSKDARELYSLGMGEERSGYYYLTHFDENKLYSYENGLNSDNLKTCNFL